VVLNQQVAQRMLKILGYQVVTVATGVEALALLQSQQPDAILMDCQIPEMDGYTVTMRIREQEQVTGRHVPIIALTANALQGERERCLAAGMDDYLSKPFKLAELEQVLKQCLSRVPTADTDGPTNTDHQPDADADRDAVLLDMAAFWIGTGIVATNQAAGDLARQIMATFQSDVANQLRHMQTALAQGDEQTVRVIAHRLRGSAAQLGARRLAHALHGIEASPDTTDWLHQVQTVEALAEATRAAFDDALHRELTEPSEHQTQPASS
ncbi:MAG: response regulator, partial [Chloracidobacterium sp.]